MRRDKEIKNIAEEGTNQPVNITVLQICYTVYMFPKYPDFYKKKKKITFLHVVFKVKAISFNRKL